MQRSLIITIDTEEDSWSDYSRDCASCENINSLIRMQDLFDKYSAKPTYLTTYQVAINDNAATILNRLVSGGKGEIGAHCHPWNTPPFDEELSVSNTMLCNLKPALQFQKLKTLTQMLTDRFTQPLSFRAGRWGYGPDVAKSLSSLGYRIDTSLTPFMNWSNFNGPDFSSVPSLPYRFISSLPYSENRGGELFEVPVSIGFSRKNFSFCNNYLNYFSKNRITKKLFCGSLSRLKILRKIWLSPELSSSGDMISLIKILSQKKHYTFNMMFHSNTLMPGKTPFVLNEYALNEFFERIEKVLIFCKKNDFKFITLKNLLT